MIINLKPDDAQYHLYEATFQPPLYLTLTSHEKAHLGVDTLSHSNN